MRTVLFIMVDIGFQRIYIVWPGMRLELFPHYSGLIGRCWAVVCFSNS